MGNEILPNACTLAPGIHSEGNS